MAGLRPGTSPPPVRMPIVPFPMARKIGSNHGAEKPSDQRRQRHRQRSPKGDAQRGPAATRAAGSRRDGAKAGEKYEREHRHEDEDAAGRHDGGREQRQAAAPPERRSEETPS